MGAWPPVRKEDLDRRIHQFVCHSAERPLSVNPAGRQAHTHSEGTPDSGHSLNDQPDSTHSPTAPTQAREDEHLGPPTDVRRQRLPCTDHQHSMGDPTPQQTPLNASHSPQGHRSSWSTSHHSHRGARLRLLRRPPRRRPVLIAPPAAANAGLVISLRRKASHLSAPRPSPVGHLGCRPARPTASMAAPDKHKPRNQGEPVC